MRKKIILFLAFVMVVIPSIRVEAKALPNMKIYVDGTAISFPIAPEISKENRTFVPFRAIAEQMGINVTWVAKERKIIAQDVANRKVELYVGKKQGYIDGQAFALDSAPYITKGHTLIPLRFFSEAFGASVQWNGKANTITIDSASTHELYTLSYYGLKAFEHRQYASRFDGMAYMWSSISKDGNLNTSRYDEGNLNEFFWPEDHPSASTADIIQSGTSKGNDAYLMVAALTMEPIKALLTDKDKQELAIEEMLSLAQEHNLNGILLDFEGFTSKDDEWRDKYTSFVQQLDRALEKEDKKLIIAVTPKNNYFNNYDYKELAQAADFIVLMAYGYIPVGTQQPEPNSSVAKGIEQTLKLVPKEKMLLGINLVHESDASMKEKIALAKRYRLKGTAYWLLNQLDMKQMEQIEQLSH